MKVIILFMAGLLAGSAASCTRDNEEDAYEKSSIVKVGDEIPDFSVTNETGTVGKGDLAGKKTLLVLFSSACEDCRVVLPVLEAAWKALMPVSSSQVRHLVWRAVRRVSNSPGIKRVWILSSVCLEGLSGGVFGSS